MEMKFSKKTIEMNKILSPLDKFVFDFCRILDDEKIRYVIVSGYVAIVFGRSRNTEDVDIIVEKIPYEKFERLWNRLKKKYECLNTNEPKTAYYEYLKNKTAVRFSRKGEVIPNFEFKFPKMDEDVISLNNSVELRIKNKRLFISPIELQIVYKLKLESEKDVGDAIFLYELFKEKIDEETFKNWIAYFKIKENIIKELDESYGSK
ncbi:MAG: hypothetical protein N3G74_01200 [Candidatus Micrarchaeota archaeon]|nr:hypothetical protein [Candidatus Micrarchaeota archaeon]